MPSLATTCSRESVSCCRECGHAAIRESMPPQILLACVQKNHSLEARGVQLRLELCGWNAIMSGWRSCVNEA